MLQRFSALFVLLLIINACGNKKNDNKALITPSSSSEIGLNDTTTSNSSRRIIVYYFHGERKCTTCKAVGKIAKETIDSSFNANIDVVFQDIDISLENNKSLASKYEMTGSGLMLVKGNKVKDLTTLAFLKALNNPDELKDAILVSIKEFQL